MNTSEMQTCLDQYFDSNAVDYFQKEETHMFYSWDDNLVTVESLANFLNIEESLIFHNSLYSEFEVKKGVVLRPVEPEFCVTDIIIKLLSCFDVNSVNNMIKVHYYGDLDLFELYAETRGYSIRDIKTSLYPFFNPDGCIIRVGDYLKFKASDFNFLVT